MVVTCDIKGAHKLLALERLIETWVSSGQGRETWEHAQEVDPSSLNNMGVSERLDDPIDTPTRSPNGQLEECIRKGAHYQGWGASVQETNI
jgi:hypothetical protein